jgi:hypothetical protein
LWAAVRTPGVAPPGLPAFAGAVLGGTLVVIAILVWHGVHGHGNPAWHFYEARAGTYYSGILLVASAGLSLAIARRLAGRALARFWLVAGVGFLFLTADELTLIHEGVDKWIHARLGWPADDPITDHIDDAIMVLYGIVALVWAFRYRETLLRLRWATRLLSTAFVAFLVMESLDVVDVSKTLEEAVKVMSEALIVVGLFAALRDPVLADAP